MATKATELAQFASNLVYDTVTQTASGLTFELPNSGVTAATYGSSTAIPVITVDAKGRITSASTSTVTSLPDQSGNTGKYLTTNGTAASWDTLTTDDVGEGTNLYFTNDRARTAVSVTDSGGDGSLSYNNTTGVFTYTGPSASEVRAHFSAGTAITITDGVIAHSDTSSVGNLSVSSVNGVVIKDLSFTFDTNGHVTAATAGTVDLDSRYYTETEADTKFVDVAGDTMSGYLTLHANPSNSLHAVTKQYVDEIAQGLKAKPAVEIATTANLDATYSNGTSGVGATLTANTNGAWPQIDGVTLTSTTPGNNGVLVKNQSNPAYNGRYNLTQLGNGSTPWILTRCGLCDEASEIPGAYVFVKTGTLYAGTGWVQTVTNPATYTVGTDPIIVTQFSGAGTYTAGSGLSLVGTQFSHSDSSSVADLTASSRTYVTGMTFDTFGHVTAYTTAAETVTDTNTTYSLDGSGSANSVNIELVAGGSGSGTDTINLVGSGIATAAWDEGNQRITVTATEADTLQSVTNRGNTTSTTIQHGGLSMSTGTNVDQIYTVTDSLTLTTSWQDTSINASELATGTYIVQVENVHDYTVGGGHYNEYYSGIMSWYASSTNSTSADEIVLHRAGHAPNSGAIYLRIQRQNSGGTDLRLQIAGATTNSGASNYTFKFRRMI